MLIAVGPRFSATVIAHPKSTRPPICRARAADSASENSTRLVPVNRPFSLWFMVMRKILPQPLQ